MKPLVLQSEDFFYWDPEAVCEYPVLSEREYSWFSKEQQDRRVSNSTQQRAKEFFHEIH